MSTSEWKELKAVIQSDGVKKLQAISEEFLINARSKSGKNLLHVSVKHGNLKATEHLLKIGCDVNNKNEKTGRTPFGLAISLAKDTTEENDSVRKFHTYCNRRDIIKLLLNSEADISWTNVTGKESLEVIDFGSQCNVLCNFFNEKYSKDTGKILISKGWPLDAVDCLRDFDFTKKAIEAIPGLKEKEKELEQAIKNQKEDLQENLQRIKQLIEPLIPYKTIIRYVLCLVIESRCRKPTFTKIIRMLLDTGVRLDFPDFQWECQDDPLLEALRADDFNVAWILLDYGAKLSYVSSNFTEEWMVNSTRCSFHYNLKHSPKDIEIVNKSLLLMEHGSEDLGSLTEFYSTVIERYLETASEKDKAKVYNYPMPIVKWIAKLRYLGVDESVCSRFEQIMNDKGGWYFKSDKIKMVFSKCNNEIKKMKKCVIDGDLTIHDIFVKPIDEIVPFTRDPKIKEKFESIISNETFKIYGDTLWFKFEKAYNKRLLIDQSQNV